MVVKPKWLKYLNNPVFFILCGLKPDFTNVKKYLVANDFYDDHNMKRQTRCLYAIGILLITTFRHCSEDVKVKLFKSYCSSIYCCYLWAKFHYKH